MTHIGNKRPMPRHFNRTGRAKGGAFVVAMIGLSAVISAQAEPQEKVTAFAHKYVPVYNDMSTMPSLMVRAPPSKP